MSLDFWCTEKPMIKTPQLSKPTKFDRMALLISSMLVRMALLFYGSRKLILILSRHREKMSLQSNRILQGAKGAYRLLEPLRSNNAIFKAEPIKAADTGLR